MGTTSTTVSSAEQNDRPSLVLHYLLNLLIAIIWVVLTYFGSRPDWAKLSWETLFLTSLIVRQSSFIVLFLIRKPAKVTSKQIKEWVVAILGTFMGYLYISTTKYTLFISCSTIYIIMTVIMLLNIIAILSLGDSFGVVPANRGIKTKGLYAFVRHPMYAFYIYFDLLLITVRFCWFNILVFGAFFVATYLRAIYEEGLLRQDPVYQEYARQTPYMFIPGIL